ncbi:MAG: hypothetical protein LBQ49_00975 [Rickettsiales bacterium]|jgi:hypothetical protein|nr:hypothetical protein [Rickettsiales bacterium]
MFGKDALLKRFPGDKPGHSHTRKGDSYVIITVKVGNNESVKCVTRTYVKPGFWDREQLIIDNGNPVEWKFWGRDSFEIYGPRMNIKFIDSCLISNVQMEYIDEKTKRLITATAVIDPENKKIELVDVSPAKSVPDLDDLVMKMVEYLKDCRGCIEG